MTRSPDRAPGIERRRDSDLAFGHSSTSALLPPDPARVAAIRESHERCAALGLTRIGSPDYSRCSRPDMSIARERNHRLSVHAVPVMELLLEQILVTRSMVVLTDAEGTVLHSIGHEEQLERAAKIALAPGVNWCEANKGTNAMGTALIAEEPMVVHADEHFIRAHEFLTCSAAPILDSRGTVLGVLNVTGDHRSYHTHTMGLVKMSARMIENHWMTDDCRHALRLHFHKRPECIDTLMEGIVTVGHDGRIVGANRGALDLLGMSAAAVRKHGVSELFGIGLSVLVDHCRASIGTPLRVTLAGGLQVHARVRSSLPVWQATGEVGGVGVVDQGLPAAVPAPPARPAAAASSGSAGLACLQTGDPNIEGIIAKLRRALDRDMSVMILGETGTGKEVFARAIHQDSVRADRPFVPVNFAALPEALVEGELFGTGEGAAQGKIAQAQGGTLFLDEIGDMPAKLQSRLLQVLQDRHASSPASTAPGTPDLAIISASHRNLREMVERHEFREDLYYRLNGLSVRLPALRERSDLRAVSQKILRAECRGRVPELDAEVLRLFECYPWPGNLRQLSNVLRAAAMMAAGEPVILRTHLPDDFLEEAQPAPPLSRAATVDDEPPADEVSPAGTEPSTLEEVELQAIMRVMKEVNGNVSHASKRLGITRATLYRKLRRAT